MASFFIFKSKSPEALSVKNLSGPERRQGDRQMNKIIKAFIKRDAEGED